MNLESSVKNLKGVGEKYCALLEKLNIFTLKDLVFNIPIRYKDYTNGKNLGEVKYGEEALFKLEVVGEPKTVRLRGNMTKTSFYAGDDTGFVNIMFFNQVYLKQKIKTGSVFYCYGKLEYRGKEAVISSPEMFFDKKPYDFLPVYPLTAGITQNFIRKITKEAIEKAELSEIYSPEFILKYDVMPVKNAVRIIHMPGSIELAKRARDRIVFDEFLMFAKAVEEIDSFENVKNENVFDCSGLLEEFCEKLTFPLTGAQKRVMEEIEKDTAGDRYMNRLVQGDVGCGKTVIAFYAMFCGIKNGFQCAMMAPTEILAAQHYEEASKIFGTENIALLTGSVTKKKKKEICEKIKNGEIKTVIGTHAIIFSSVEFKNLGMIITDEQHKFGVAQRARLAKNKDVHTLIMSATPIPRSLMMVFYGKSDISLVDEMPPGRQKVDTFIIGKSKYRDMISFFKSEMDKKRQIYVVCPLIEDNDGMPVKSAGKLKKEYEGIFDGYSVGLLHGKMKNDEKNSVMQSFKKGEIQLLVSTTVVEVGVNVPNATVMCIMNAERFGLAQLHQLRGRVGRGSQKSYCFLVLGSGGAYERLAIMTKTNNGFEIAKEDMIRRGGGDIFGKRQHGRAGLKYGDIIADAQIIEKAKKALDEIKNDKAFADDYKKICESSKEYYKDNAVDIVFN